MQNVIISLLLALTAIAPALAQETPPALIVTLRDVTGAGVPGIAVVVTDRGGATILARGTTAADGRVVFGPLPTTDVRVQVTGKLPDGIALSLPGQDAPGVAVILGVPAVTLALRSEPDGTVRPDPADLALEPGVVRDGPQVGRIPTARPAATLTPTTPALLADPPARAADTLTPATLVLGLLILALLLLGVAGVLLIQRGGRHP